MTYNRFKFYREGAITIAIQYGVEQALRYLRQRGINPTPTIEVELIRHRISIFKI